jgi:uncharacterized protein YqiB (DUF1249 family)
MFVDSLIVPECTYRPGSFTGLMTIYESNFIKLGHLVSDLERLPPKAVSCTSRDCDLHLERISRERYTSTLKLTYWFEEPSERLVADPNLTVRVYHDAGLVEAVRGCEHHRHRKLRELALAHTAELGRRWRSNIMLNKWLDYVLDMGHSFP